MPFICSVHFAVPNTWIQALGSPLVSARTVCGPAWFLPLHIPLTRNSPVAPKSLTSPELVKKTADMISGKEHLDIHSLTLIKKVCCILGIDALDEEPWLTVTLSIKMGSLVDKDTALIPLSCTALSQRSESIKRVQGQAEILQRYKDYKITDRQMVVEKGSSGMPGFKR